MSSVTDEQLAAYERDGFLVLENFCAPTECETLRARMAEMLTTFEPQTVKSVFTTRAQTRASDNYFLTSGDKVRFFFEEFAFDENGEFKQSLEKSVNKVGHALHDLDATFEAFSYAPKIAELARALGYRQPLVAQSMYIFKQPRIGGEVTCHQDATFLYTDPLTVTGLWFALEDATIKNGCLWAIAGGHKAGLKRRFRRKADGKDTEFVELNNCEWDDAQLTPLEVGQGALIILHGLLPHLSYQNTSPHSRHAYTLHLMEADANYPADNWLQRPDPALPFRALQSEPPA